MSFIRRRSLLVFLGGAGLLTLVAASSRAADTSPQARLGAPAPNFTLTDSNGKSVSLADFKGKTVVLEWTNHECPYVRKHYSGNNMQGLQKKWTGARRGLADRDLLGARRAGLRARPRRPTSSPRRAGAAPTAVLFDPKGDVGRSYGAQVTPHMYVITGDGTLVYMGGIDDKPTTRLEDLKTAKNFVDAALSEIAQGKRSPSPRRVPTAAPLSTRRKARRRPSPLRGRRGSAVTGPRMLHARRRGCPHPPLPANARRPASRFCALLGPPASLHPCPAHDPAGRMTDDRRDPDPGRPVPGRRRGGGAAGQAAAHRQRAGLSAGRRPDRSLRPRLRATRSTR